jgi:hypothetical protein
LSSFSTDTDDFALAGCARITNINIIVPLGKITAGGIAQGDIVRSRRIMRERVVALSGIVASGCITDERINTCGGVVVAAGVT